MSATGRYVVRVRPLLEPAIFADSLRSCTALPAGEVLRRAYGADAAHLLGAARQGLALALSAAGIGAGDEVAVADFNCSTVMDSVHACGARCRFFDIRDDARPDLATLRALCAEERVRALVLTHYFGHSAVTPELVEFVRELRARGVPIVEDCAHTMLDDAQPEIGSLGDVLLFSMGNDKPIAAGKCGILLVRGAALAQKVSQAVAAAPVRSEGEERRQAVWNLVYWALTAPEVCHSGIVSVFPKSAAVPSQAEYADLVAAFAERPTLETLKAFPAAADQIAHAHEPGVPEPVAPFRAGPLTERLASATLAAGLLARANAARTANRAALDAARGVSGGVGARLRYTVAFPDAAAATRAAAAAREAGIEAGCFNWDPLMSAELGERREQPAWAVRPERVVNFPVHPDLTPADIAAIAAALRGG